MVNVPVVRAELIGKAGPITAVRFQAHLYFDQIWKNRHLSKKAAYKWLARVLNKKRYEAHFSKLSPEECDRVIELLKENPKMMVKERRAGRRGVYKRNRKRRYPVIRGIDVSKLKI
jgi:hypothetical protein